MLVFGNLHVSPIHFSLSWCLRFPCIPVNSHPCPSHPPAVHHDFFAQFFYTLIPPPPPQIHLPPTRQMSTIRIVWSCLRWIKSAIFFALLLLFLEKFCKTKVLNKLTDEMWFCFFFVSLSLAQRPSLTHRFPISQWVFFLGSAGIHCTIRSECTRSSQYRWNLYVLHSIALLTTLTCILWSVVCVCMFVFIRVLQLCIYGCYSDYVGDDVMYTLWWCLCDVKFSQFKQKLIEKTDVFCRRVMWASEGRGGVTACCCKLVTSRQRFVHNNFCLCVCLCFSGWTKKS